MELEYFEVEIPQCLSPDPPILSSRSSWLAPAATWSAARSWGLEAAATWKNWTMAWT